MIAEIFYPRKLKEAIVELKSNNDLNQEALSNLKNFFLKHIFGFFIIVTFIITWGYLYISMILLVILPVFVKIDGMKQINQRIMPFISGEKKNLKLTKRIFYRFGTKLVLEDESGDRYLTPRLLRSLREDNNMQLGEYIQCHLSNENTKLCMPGFPLLYENYCLSRSRMTEMDK